MSDDAEVSVSQPPGSISIGRNCIIFAGIIACLGVSWPFVGFGLIHFVYGFWLEDPSSFIYGFCFYITPLCGIVCFILLVYKTRKKSFSQPIKAELIMIMICLALGVGAVWLTYLQVHPHRAGFVLRGRVSVDQEEVFAWMRNQNIVKEDSYGQLTTAELPPSLSKLNPHDCSWHQNWDSEEYPFYLRLSFASTSAIDHGFFFGDPDRPYPYPPEISPPVIEIAPGFWAY